MGRPVLPADQRRVNQRIKVNFTATEYARIKALAEARGLAVSTLLRSLAIQEARAQRIADRP